MEGGVIFSFHFRIGQSQNKNYIQQLFSIMQMNGMMGHMTDSLHCSWVDLKEKKRRGRRGGHGAAHDCVVLAVLSGATYGKFRGVYVFYNSIR